MNPKPTSINPTVTYRVPSGIFKTSIATIVFATGTAMALSYNNQPAALVPPVVIPNTTPSTYEIQQVKITSDTTGEAAILLDGFTLKFDFWYQAHPDSNGALGGDFTTVEVTEIGEITVTTASGQSFNDFTNYNDLRNINLLLAGYIMRNKLVEAI